MEAKETLMKKLQLLMMVLCLLWAGSGASAAETECDVWLGTWDMTKTDGSTYVWVITNIVTGTSGNILCQAQGTSTPNAGGPTVAFQIIQVSFLPELSPIPKRPGWAKRWTSTSGCR